VPAHPGGQVTAYHLSYLLSPLSKKNLSKGVWIVQTKLLWCDLHALPIITIGGMAAFGFLQDVGNLHKKPKVWEDDLRVPPLLQVSNLKVCSEPDKHRHQGLQ